MAEGLAHLQVVEGRIVRVHREVVGGEVGIGVQFAVQFRIGLYPCEFGVVRDESEVDLVRLVGGEKGRRRRSVVQLGDYRFQEGPRGPVIIRIGLEHDPVGLGPFLQVERSAGDGSLRAGGPGVAVFLDRLSGGNPAVDHQVRHVGAGFVGLDQQRVVVERVHAQRIEGKFPADDPAPVFDRTVVPLHVVGVLGIGPATKGEDPVVGGQRLAVGEFQVIPQVEIPSQAVRGGLPAVRRGGDQVEVLVESDQRFRDDPVAVCALVDRAEPFHVGVVELEQADVLLGGRRRVGRKRDTRGVYV